MFTEVDVIFASIFSLAGFLGISLNLFVLYCAFWKSPRHLREYRILIICSALTDLAYTISISLLQPRLIPTGPQFIYVALGPARFVDSKFCYLCYCFLLNAILFKFLTFPFSFYYRYRILTAPLMGQKRLSAICLATYALTIPQLVTFIMAQSDNQLCLDVLAQFKPNYDLSEYMVSCNHLLHEPLSWITLFTTTLPMFPIYLTVIHYRQKVLRFMISNQMSARTKKSHQVLIQALTVHAAIPVLFIFPPILLYASYHIRLQHWFISEYIIYVLFSFVPASCGAVTILYITPYRAAMQELLCPWRARKAVMPAATFAEHSGQPNILRSMNKLNSNREMEIP